ncbi:MAG: hypothetical protein EOP04_17725 [Proteobacteria bacterium]|nr:MAG: hypothetical protein EOP04_17725 [Pseudomonadota bacterium]
MLLTYGKQACHDPKAIPAPCLVILSVVEGSAHHASSFRTAGRNLLVLSTNQAFTPPSVSPQLTAVEGLFRFSAVVVLFLSSRLLRNLGSQKKQKLPPAPSSFKVAVLDKPVATELAKGGIRRT